MPIEQTIDDTGVAATPRARRNAKATEVNFERLRAPFSLRCGAALIDYSLVVGILALSTLLARALGDGTRNGSATYLFVGYTAAALAAFLNVVLLAAWSGRTLGKWITGLRIERRDGGELSIPRALLRHCVGYLLTLMTLGLGFLLAVFNSEGRALHDMLAGTIVVRGRTGGGRAA